MTTIFEWQRWLHAGAMEALGALASTGLAGLPALIGAAFGFGMLHALLPGHGKSVLLAHYAGGGRFGGAVVSSILLVATHVGSAVLLVLGGFTLLQRTIGGAGRAPILERASAILILVVGLWLLWRSVRPHQHGHVRSGPALALVTGIVPCPLTTFTMAYAVANGLIVPGLLLSGMFAAGMVVTVAAFPLAAILFRSRLVTAMMRTEAARVQAGRVLEVGAAVGVVLVGLWPLLN